MILHHESKAFWAEACKGHFFIWNNLWEQKLTTVVGITQKKVCRPPLTNDVHFYVFPWLFQSLWCNRWQSGATSLWKHENIPFEASQWPCAVDRLLGVIWVSPWQNVQHDEEDCLNTNCHWSRTFSDWFMDQTLILICPDSHLVREQHVMQ